MYLSLVFFFFISFSLTNNIDGQHMLSNVPNGPVTNGVMTYAIPSEGNSVTDRGYDERLSSHVTPDTNGSTSPSAHENGRDAQEHCNGSSSSATGAAAAEESSLLEQQRSEEKCETHANKDKEHVQQEEAPERESKDPGAPVEAATGVPAEQKQTTSQKEVKQMSTSEQSKTSCTII